MDLCPVAALQGPGRCEVPCAIGGNILGTSLEESIWILPSGASLPPSPKGSEEGARTGDEALNSCYLGETVEPTL